jgi:hypothetical protein
MTQTDNKNSTQIILAKFQEIISNKFSLACGLPCHLSEFLPVGLIDKVAFPQPQIFQPPQVNNQTEDLPCLSSIRPSNRRKHYRKLSHSQDFILPSSNPLFLLPHASCQYGLRQRESDHSECFRTSLAPPKTYEERGILEATCRPGSLDRAKLCQRPVHGRLRHGLR